MNAKKKNKKANKPPNPNPPQNVESVPVKETIEVAKCEEKKVLEEISEVTVVPVSDLNEVESETPKKPKRNKGKNKKPDKEETHETEEKVMAPLTAVDKIEEPAQNITLEDKECKEETGVSDVIPDKSEALEEANIVPSARKKKNKKKSQEKSTEETPSFDENKTITDEKVTEAIEKVDSEIQELFSSKPETPKQEHKKKKNKKKNRNDSEKSDKSENIISCTSAFQNVLTESKQAEIECEVETNENTAIVEIITETMGSVNLSLSDLKTETVEKTKEITEIENVKDQKDENKSKKKNKKDKTKQQQQQKEPIESFKTEVPEIAPLPEPVVEAENKNVILQSEIIKADNTNTSAFETKIAEIIMKPLNTSQQERDEYNNKKKNKKDKVKNQQQQKEKLEKDLLLETCKPADVSHETIILEESKLDLKESIPPQPCTQKEPSPKPKAKIAKPVEMKQKTKIESEIVDKSTHVESVVDEQKEKDSPIVNIVQSQDDEQANIQLTSDLSTTKHIDIPSDGAMGKKRKKSPKPQKAGEAEFKSTTESKKCDETTEVVEESIKTVSGIPSDIPSVFSQLLEFTNKPCNVVSKDVTMPQMESKSPQEAQEELFASDLKKDNEGFEIKTNKKKKKTHKVPQDNLNLVVKDIEITKKEDIKNVSGDSEQRSNEPKFITETPISLPLISHLAGDSDSQNLTKVVEPLSQDIAPEVQFTRSSSQHLFDSNNNAVIQEVINIGEVKNDPELMPTIEGSGSTPVRTPEPVSSGIKISEIDTWSPTEEKTDIKSKMMEVNQDMEELRLSIERSLAEFTSLEKCDKESEQVTVSILKRIDSPDKDYNKEKNTEDIVANINEYIPDLVEIKESDNTIQALSEDICKPIEIPPVCPARKDNKGKNKSKKKGKHETTITSSATSTTTCESSQSKDKSKEKEEKSEKNDEKKSDSSQEKGKQQSAGSNNNKDPGTKDADCMTQEKLTSESVVPTTDQIDFEPIEHFEDALTSSIDDVNKTFEMIAKDADDENIESQKKLAANKPAINITTAEEGDTKRSEKINPVSQPKNLLGQTDIPVQSNKTDYKKEKNKTPNARQARVKIKDAMDIESKKESKESQTDIKRSRKALDKSVKESFSRVKTDNEEYVYKYSFRKVFLQSACHVCNKFLSQVRVPCGYCSLVFYCSAKHKDEDWPQHQAMCFSVSTLAHMKDQKHIYADASNITGQDYRLLRMQMIVSCEKVLKRRLVPWEQEIMLYPRMCADVACREWRQGKLKDCDGCGQLSFCSAHPEHLPKTHGRWCKSYSLYQKLVSYQQTSGRLGPPLPTKLLAGPLPGKMNEVLAALYEEKIDMNDIQYASLTQLATAPLTAAHCLQVCRGPVPASNGLYKKPFTIHVVGAELQFEADGLNKWETFFLHLRPDVSQLTVVLISPLLNPGNLPLDLLAKVKLCDNCQQNKQRLTFKFVDGKNYFEYRVSEDFINPDIICAFNPSIQRSSIYNGKDPWPSSINAIIKLKTPFVITSYTLNELRKDVARVQEVSEGFKLVMEPSFNTFASVRPDRNFISDDEIPLLFKNYCVAVVLGC